MGVAESLAFRVAGAAQNGEHFVLVVGGGYPASSSGGGAAGGNRLFMMDAATGKLLWTAGDQSRADRALPRMTHAVAARVAAIDTDGDGFADRMYAADVGGRIWRFDIWNGRGPGDLVTGGVLASLGAGVGFALKTIIGAALLVGAMLTIVPKLLAPLAKMAERRGKLTHFALGAVTGAFLLSAYAADFIGLHSVFGGFMLGAVMPRGFLASALRRLLEPFATVILVPVFFCYSGLSTQLTTVFSANLLLIAFAVLAASIFAKFGACWAAARLTGQNNSTALAVGAPMNARGLMELIIINIGLQRGLIEAPLFSIMVLMTVVTTFMATPVFEWTYGRKARERGELGALSDDDAVEDAAIRSERR